jgi:hypothetical protein
MDINVKNIVRRTNWKKRLTEKRYEEFKVERVKAFYEYQKIFRSPSKMESLLPVISDEDFFSNDPEETRELFIKNQKKFSGVGVIDNSDDPDFWTTL